MRDEDHRHHPLQPVDRLREVLRRLLVEVGHGLVEDQNLRPLEQRSGNGEALPLPARQPGPPFPDLRLIAVRQLLDHLVDLGGLAGEDDVLEAGMRVGHDQVVVY